MRLPGGLVGGKKERKNTRGPVPGTVSCTREETVVNEKGSKGRGVDGGSVEWIVQ